MSSKFDEHRRAAQDSDGKSQEDKYIVTRSRYELVDELTRILAEASIPNAGSEAAAIAEAAARQVVSAECSERTLAMAKERAAGTPLAYLVGQARFMELDLFVAPGALIPREETELLGRTSLHILNEHHIGPEPRVIDMCCGTGNLTCALASKNASVRIWASDLTDGAVAVARANVERLGISDRVAVLQGDLFMPLSGLNLEGTVDMVVCNPPYISSGKLTKAGTTLSRYEPWEAFDGGPYGVSIFQRVISAAAGVLKPAGHLVLEIGAGQHRAVSGLFARAGQYEPAVFVNDDTGTPRVVWGRKKSLSAHG